MDALIRVLLSVYEKLRSRKSMSRLSIHSFEKVRKDTKNNLYTQIKFYFFNEINEIAGYTIAHFYPLQKI